jgi:hypothetical protein
MGVRCACVYVEALFVHIMLGYLTLNDGQSDILTQAAGFEIHIQRLADE